MTSDVFEGFELTEHLADIGIATTASTRERALEFSCLGLMEIMTTTSKIGRSVEHRFVIDDAEPTIVLRRVLSEVLFLVSSDNLVFGEFHVEWSDAVRVVCIGEMIDPEKHELHGEVKAITSSRISFEEHEGFWRSFVLVDV